jgi:hypothetical protein
VYLAHIARKAARELHAVVRATTPTHSELRDRMVAIARATVGVDLVCGVLAYVFEHSSHDTEIKTFGSALFWTSTQLLTVSSQLPNPLSVPGRILDVFMEAYAITVVATLAASIGAFMVRRGREAERAADDAAHGHSAAGA